MNMRMLALVLAGILVFAKAQDQRFYFNNSPQGRFVSTFQSPDNGYFQQASFKPNSPQFSPSSTYLKDLQTSELPTHLQETLPQYQYRFIPTNVQNPVPFQTRPQSPETIFYNQNAAINPIEPQVQRPQPFQPALKPSTFKPPHSHYLTHNGHHDPSQTETFLGQITLQSPEIPADFNRDIPVFRPSKDFPFHSHSLVDQFSSSDDKWRKLPNNTRNKSNRVSNKPFREEINQNLDEYEKDQSQFDGRFGLRKPEKSNALHTNTRTSNIPQHIRTYGTNDKQKPKNQPTYLVNNNGDVYKPTRSGFRPKPTTSTTPTTTHEYRNRFSPSTKSPNKPITIHLKSNKIPFVPRRPASTTESSFDLAPLLEDPVVQRDQSSHKNDVEVIQFVSTTPEPTTTEEATTMTITETDATTETIETTEYYESTTTIPENITNDYTNVSVVTTEKYATTETPITESPTEYPYDSYSEYSYDEEYTETEPHNITQVTNSITDNDKTTITDSTTETIPESTTDAIETTTLESNFDILTMKPSLTVKDDNFNGFVDSTLIDNITEEPHVSENITEPPTTTTEATTAHVEAIEPILIGEAVVSVVTTKSVVNGTISVPPTPTPHVTQQMSPPTPTENTTDSWIVVASVQTSRSVSGARYLSFPVIEQERRTSIKNKGKEDAKKTDEPAQPNSEDISNKPDDQSELYSPEDVKNNIELITENPPETTTTEKPTPKPSTSIPVTIRKFSANLRPSTTTRPRKLPPTIKMTDLSALLPKDYKHKASLDEIPQGDEPPKDDNVNQARSSGISQQNKIIVQDMNVSLPPNYKEETAKPVDDFLTKIRDGKVNKTSKLIETAQPVDISKFLPPGYKQSTSTVKPKLDTRPKTKPIDITAFLPPGYKSNTSKPKVSEDLLAKAEPVDIKSLLPPGFKLQEPTTETPKSNSGLLSKAQPVDISSFLPPGYKPTKDTVQSPKNNSNLFAKAEPVDVSSLLPPGYSSKSTTTEKVKGIQNILASAKEEDINSFLPPGYKPRFVTRKPITTTTETQETTTEKVSTSAPSSTASSGFKVVFPSRPGGRKPINRITTPKSIGGDGPIQTAPTIHKGWPTRATTEFTGWPTPSTTPISIEKLLAAAKAATATTSSADVDFTVSTSTTTTTTTTTTTPAPTTPGVCVGECDLAATIKLVGGAKWVPELLDHNTKEWQILANEVQSQLEQVYSRSAILSKWYKRIRIEEFSPGSVLVDYFVELTDLGRQVNTQELKRIFHETLYDAPQPKPVGRSIDGDNTIEDNTTAEKLALGNFVVDPKYTDFIVVHKQIIPTVGYAEDNLFLPQWAIAVIVIGLASLLFVIIFGVTVLVNRQKNAKKKQPATLTEEMLNELNKNHMGGVDNYGAEDLYNMEDVWNEKPYDTKPQKKRSSGSLHDNSMSNLYDSWRSEWNGYYYNAYYGNNPGSSTGGFQRRRSDYDTNF